MKKIVCLVLVCGALGAWSQAEDGPFITNLSIGTNEIVVEKCQVEHNFMTGLIRNVDCTSQTIKR